MRRVIAIGAFGVFALLPVATWADEGNWEIHATGAVVEAVGAGAAAQGVPIPGDECEERIPLPFGLSPFTTTGATPSGAVDPFCDGPMFNDIWLNLFPFLTGQAIITVEAGFAPRIAALDGCSCLPLSQVIACSEGTGTTVAQIQFPVIAGNCYKIDLGGQFPGKDGNGQIDVRIVQGPMPTSSTWGITWITLVVMIVASLAIRGRTALAA